MMNISNVCPSIRRAVGRNTIVLSPICCVSKVKFSMLLDAAEKTSFRP